MKRFFPLFFSLFPLINPAISFSLPPSANDAVSNFSGVRGLQLTPSEEKPSGPARRVQEQINEIGRQVDEAPSQKAREDILRANLPDVVPALTSPEMDSVPPPARNRYMNALADVLNLLGGKDDKKSFESSFKLADNVLGRSPDDKDALNNRATSNLGLGRLDSAIKDASAALALDPAGERAFTTRALAYYNSGNYVKALEDARRALDLNRNNETAYHLVKVSESRITTAGRLGLNPRERALAEQVKEEYRMLERESALAGAGPVLTAPASRPGPERIPATAPRASPAGRTPIPEPEGAEPSLVRTAAETSLLNSDRALAKDPEDAYAFRTRARAKKALGDIAGWLADLRQAARFNRQFEAEYLEAASAHRIRPRVPDYAERPAGPPPERRVDRSWLVLGTSLAGGGLMAFGLANILSSRRARRTRGFAPARLEAGYEIVHTIGNGGMGVVMEARDRALGRRVAIKRMRDEIKLDESQRRRFLQEARIVAALHHPNIVDIHTILEEGDGLYLVFEFVEGQTLEQVLAVRKKLSLEEARPVLRGVLAALEYAHRRGVVHRDLKPSNIMIGADGTVKVMDFGIARQVAGAAGPSPATATAAGTPQYMAPEQERGIVRKESDFFALGACLYEMLTGQRPSRVRAPLPAGLDALIDAALEPDPDLRIATAAEFRSRLDAVSAPSVQS